MRVFGAMAIAAVGAMGLALPANAAAVVHPDVITICDPNHDWYTTSTTSTYLRVKTGDSAVRSAPSSAPLAVTKDLSRTVTMSAAYTASVGGNLSISVPVRGFNAAAGLDTSVGAAMDVSLTFTGTVTENITIPAGHSMLEYVGTLMTNATVSHYLCNSNGTAVSTLWRGTINGPRLAASGWIDCVDTNLC